MAEYFGDLGFADADYAFAAVEGQRIIFDASNALLETWTRDVEAALRCFVSGPTETHAERYKLPGGGYLEETDPASRPGARKVIGQWDVAYPLRNYEAALIDNPVSLAYMTLAEYERHFKGILLAGENTTRFRLLKRIFNNTNETFLDPIWGSLTVKPLANGDTDVYPPLLGAVDEGTANHYLYSGYATASISDTYDPTVTMIEKLEARFGTPTGGSQIAIFCNNAETPYIRKLTGFTPIQYIHTERVYVTQKVIVPGLPEKLTAPATWRVLGTMGNNAGAVICEWRYIPAGYMVAVHLEEEAPLKIRYDPASVNLGQGMRLVAQEITAPIQTSTWRHRFGFGVSNRLSACVMQLTTDSSYTVPSAYQ